MLNRRNLRRLTAAAASVITAMMFVVSAPFFFGGGSVDSGSVLGGEIFVPGVTINETDDITAITFAVQEALNGAVTGLGVYDNAVLTVLGVKTGVTDTLSLNVPEKVTLRWMATYEAEVTEGNVLELSGYGRMCVQGSMTLTGDVTSAGVQMCAENGGTVAVKGDLTTESIGRGAVWAFNGALFTVEGNVTMNDAFCNDICADSGSKIIISGYVIIGINYSNVKGIRGVYATDTGSVLIGGDLEAGGVFAVICDGGDVTIGGNITASGAGVLFAEGGGSVTIGGTLTAEEGKRVGIFKNYHAGTLEMTPLDETEYLADDTEDRYTYDLSVPVGAEAFLHMLTGSDDGSRCGCECENCAAAGECDGSNCVDECRCEHCVYGGGDGFQCSCTCVTCETADECDGSECGDGCDCEHCAAAGGAGEAGANIGGNGVSQNISYLIGCIMLILLTLALMRMTFLILKKRKKEEEKE